MEIKSRLANLREKMQQKNIDAYIVFDTDSHQSEYVAEHWKSREWISGFTGSAGTVMVTQEAAGLWTDSRYYIQAEQELENTGIKLYKTQGEDKVEVEEWLNQRLNTDDVLGLNGECVSVKQFKDLKKKLDSKIQIKSEEDLIDEIWTGRPGKPQKKVIHYPKKYSGRSRRDKISQIREAMADKQSDGYLISALDSIAWLFNLRGKDIKYNPVAIGFGFIDKEDAYLFMDENKLEEDLITSLKEDDVQILSYNHIYDFLSTIDSSKLIYDPKLTNIKLINSIPESCKTQREVDLVTQIKASKNETELKRMREAHIKDGVAMVKFLKWLEENVGEKELTEWEIAVKVTEFRGQQKGFQGPSFGSIVAYQENGAVVHYAPDENSSAQVKPKGVLLIDSGGQYLEGTTDITRTVALGEPSQKQKKIFTMVLRAHIGLAQAVFPSDTPANIIDGFAKKPIWQQGHNYQHGTGHGIGHYLNVHDSPGYYQIRPTFDKPLEPGMVTSNEPGCYLEDEFGVRIENVIVTKEKKSDMDEFLNFETISYCPIDRELINESQFTQDELDWLNDYHDKVYEKLSPYLNEKEKTWLAGKTESM